MARTEVVHVDEDKVFERGPGRGGPADKEWGTVTQTIYNLVQDVQDVTHLVTILVIGFRAA